MMIEMVLTVCSILHGAQCQDIRQTYVAEPGQISVFACARYGQYHASKWALEHTNWSVHKWSCRSPRGRLEAKA